MKLTDSRTIQADVATIWAGLLNPEVLKECVPGCTEMAGSPGEGFEATVVQKVGPVKATFKGAVHQEGECQQVVQSQYPSELAQLPAHYSAYKKPRRNQP